MEKLKGLLESVRKDFDSKGETIEHLKEAITVYKEYMASKKEYFDDPKAKIYFFEDLTPSIIQGLISSKIDGKTEVSLYCIV